MSRKEIDALDAIAKAQAERFMREQSMQFAECAINLMASSMPMKDVIEYLERQVEMLREFG